MEKAIKVDIGRFDGNSNFSLWQSRVKDVLIQHGLIDALLCEQRPTTVEETTWRRLQMQAGSTIRLNLADDVALHVLNETSPTMIWAKLEELYMGRSLTNTLFLWKQFYQLRMTEGQSVQQHLSSFQRVLTDLLSVGEKVEEKTRALVLLSSLPPSFESLVTALIVGKSTIKMEEVTSALLQNEVLKRENKASSSGGNSAMTVSGGDGGRGRSGRGSRGGRSRSKSRDASKIRCYRCDELGHRVRDCPQLKDRTKAIAAVANIDEDSETKDDVFMVTKEVSTSPLEWIMDSASIHHVCCREELFDSLESLESTVQLPDGSSCAVKGIGTVSLSTHDGLEERLDEVRYVPSFKQNLISLSKLDSNGHTWKAGDGILKVLRGNRVIIKGSKYGGHYFFTGSSTRGGVRSGAPGGAHRGVPQTHGHGTGCETREHEGRRRRQVKFLLPQRTSPSRSQVRRTQTKTEMGSSSLARPMFANS